MKTLLSITTLLLILLSVSSVSAQNSNLSNSNIEQLREERTIAIFNQQNKHDLVKQKEMGEVFTMNVEKADLQTKRREIQVVSDESFPRMVETNDPQKGSWEYAQAKKEWIAANPEKYAALMQGASAN